LTSESRLWSARCIRFAVNSGDENDDGYEDDEDVDEGNIRAIKAAGKLSARKSDPPKSCIVGSASMEKKVTKAEGGEASTRKHAAPKSSVVGLTSAVKKRMPFYNYRMNESFVLSVVRLAANT
jgi:hypothetical protein